MDEYGFFAQDSWRWKPNLTLTLGLRYELQMPFVPTNGTYTMSTLDGPLRAVGLGSSSGRPAVQHVQPGRAATTRRPDPDLRARHDPGNPGYNTDFNNFAPNDRRVVAAERAGRLAPEVPRRSGSGDGERRLHALVQPRAVRPVHGRLRRQPGRDDAGARAARRATNFPLVLPGETWPLLCASSRTAALRAAGVPADAGVPDHRVVRRRATTSAIFDPDIEVPYTRLLDRGLPAVAQPRHGGRGPVHRQREPKPWANENWNLENIIENGFLDEFKLAQRTCRPTSLAGRGGTFAFTGAGPGTSPLPIFLAHFSGAAGAARRAIAAQLHVDAVHELDLDRRPRSVQSRSGRRGGDLWTAQRRSGARTLPTAGLASNFWVMNPLVDDANVTRIARRQQLPLDPGRPSPPSLARPGRPGQLHVRAALGLLAPERTSTRFYLQVRRTSRTRSRCCGSTQIPVGRGKRFGANMNKWLDGAIGSWEFSGAGRVQLRGLPADQHAPRRHDHAEAEREFKRARIEIDPVTGATTVWDMPLDIRPEHGAGLDTAADVGDVLSGR